MLLQFSSSLPRTSHVRFCCPQPPNPSKRPRHTSSWTGFWRPVEYDDGSDNMPVFAARMQASSRGQRSRTTPSHADIVSEDEALRIIEDADQKWNSLGARAEYSRSKGVNYERALRYIPVVSSLKASLDGGDAVDTR